MTASFDPYIKWLGIRSSERPPNHYLLLGLTPFEADLDVIDAAANRQMAHVRTYQSGAQSALSQRVLNELAAARVELLNPEKKAAYDARLRAQLKQQQKAATTETHPATTASSAQKELRTRTAPISDLTTPAIPITKPHSAGPKPLVVGGLVLIVLLLVGVVVFVFFRDGNASQSDALPADANIAQGQSNSKSSNTKSPTPTEQPAVSEPSTSTENRPAVPPSQQANFVPPSTPVAPTESETEPDPMPVPNTVAVGPNTDQANADSASVEAAADPAESDPTVETTANESGDMPTETDVPARLALPDAASRQEALKSVQQIFSDEYSKAKTSATQSALAAKLLEQGRESQENATDQFVLLAEALRLATEAGDVDTAFHAWDESVAVFDVDTLGGTVKVLTNLGKKVKLSKQQQSLAQRAGEVFDAALLAGKLELAGELAEVAATAAKKAKDPELVKLTALRVKQFQDYKKVASEAAVAQKTLLSKPDDPDANLVQGRFLCLAQGDWKAGLPLLAKGGDERLKVLATEELAEPTSAADMNKLADAWWAYGNTLEAELRKPFLLHAADGYEQATAAGLSGLDASKAAKRIEEATSLGGRTVSQEQCISYTATYAVSSVSGWGPLGTLLTGFGPMHGTTFAFCSAAEAGAHITIDLGAEKTVQRLDVENRRVTTGEFDRAKGFGVWLSSTAGERGQQVWQSTEALASWNIVLPKPVRARYVTIGFPVDKAEHFHLAGVKVFGSQPQTSRGSGGSGRVRSIHRTLGYALREHPSDAVVFGGHWYKYFDNSVEPAEAQRQCALMGGYLVCLETEKEYEFIRKLPQKTGFWFGLYKGPDQKWSWVNGVPLSINHWAASEPTGDAVTADFGTGDWSDSNSPTRYVCEWEY